MLDTPSNDAKPAPERTFLRFFGLGNSGDKAGPPSKNRPPKEPEERKHQYAIWYFFAAFIGLMLIQYFWVQYTQVKTIPSSQFPTCYCTGQMGLPTSPA